jgi:hypothetical protein
MFTRPSAALRLLLQQDLRQQDQWQQDLHAVVRFVHECFVFRSSLLVVAG